MLTRFHDHLQKICPQYRQKRFLLAVSGGLDSMVMLDLFRRAGLSFVVAHVNFGLRGLESDDDETFVRDYCREAGIPFHARRAETNNYATRKKLSVQMAARELRYDFFRELLAASEADLVATAHHLNDSIENIFIGLLRGGGAEILAGIPEVNGDVIRPLTFAARHELEAYACDNQIVWREDITNTSDDYTRNVIRHHLVPVLRQVNPSLEDTVTRSINKARGQWQVMQQALDVWRSAHTTQASTGFRIAKKPLSEFVAKPTLLYHLLENYGFNYAQCNDVAEALDGQPGKIFYAPAFRLVIDRDELIVAPLHGELVPVYVGDGMKEAVMGSSRLSFDITTSTSVSSDHNVAYLDADRIMFPLQWRTWQHGDEFVPLGMKGHKKLSDFLIDQKTPLHEKDSVTVLQSGSDIVWVVGLRIDHRYRVTDETRRVLVVRRTSID